LRSCAHQTIDRPRSVAALRQEPLHLLNLRIDCGPRGSRLRFGGRHRGGGRRGGACGFPAESQGFAGCRVDHSRHEQAPVDLELPQGIAGLAAHLPIRRAGIVAFVDQRLLDGAELPLARRKIFAGQRAQLRRDIGAGTEQQHAANRNSQASKNVHDDSFPCFSLST
jgi:hypothetical protein